MNKAVKLIILDRDGVINHDSDHYIKSVQAWRPIAGSIEAIALLKQAGYCVAIATNQSGVARGYYDLDTLHAMHAKMQDLLAAYSVSVDYIAFCPHTPEENCSCRKPEIGLLQKIEKKAEHSLKGSFFIGDKESDFSCARRFGCIPILVETGYGTISLKSDKRPPKDRCFKNLLSAVDYILKV